MFNLVTLATVVIGVLALYGTLLAINLVGAFLLVPRQSLADALGDKASVASMAEAGVAGDVGRHRGRCAGCRPGNR